MNAFPRGGALARSLKQNPLVFLDVGSSGGIPLHWKPVEPWIRVVGFDADERAPVSGEGQGLLGLHRAKGVLDFFQTRKQECSSFLKPHRAFLDQFPEAERFDVVETVPMKTDTLDRQLDGRGIRDVDFMKIDTQGTELFVLEGAKRTLAGPVFGLELEVEFEPIYENQPLFSDVDAFLRPLGFRFFDLKPHYWKRKNGRDRGGPQGQLIFADALYLRDADAFLAAAGPRPAPAPSKIIRAIAVCLLYGYRDYALGLLAAARASFSAQEAEGLRKAIEGRRGFSSRLPIFPGRWGIARMVYSLWMILRPSAGGWAWSGKELGNPK